MRDEQSLNSDPTALPEAAHPESVPLQPGTDYGGLTPLVLELDRLRAYDHDPRHSTNPEYDRIKASIRATGLGQPLVVTQRPDEDDYLVAAGGNTRLQILKELHAETGQARYARVQCLFKPWTQEANVLLDHLKENDLRGGLSFLDKALALAEVKRLIAAEGDAQAVNQTQLAAILKARGFGLSQGLISQMAYAVETLLPLIPLALHGGLGRPQIERIRGLERAARMLWSEHRLDVEDDYETVFAVLCRRYDAAEWDTDSLRRALEAEIAERSGISLQAVRIALDDRLAGRRTAPVHDESGHEGTEDGDDRPATPSAPDPTVQAAETQAGSLMAETEHVGEPEKIPSLAVCDSDGQETGDSEVSTAERKTPAESGPAIGVTAPVPQDMATSGLSGPLNAHKN